MHRQLDPMLAPRRLDVVGLFAGVGGLESGLAGPQALHRTRLLCESDDGATAVLRRRFGNSGATFHGDVRTLHRLPWHRKCDLLVAGFPCQDLSSAGRTNGIGGSHSGLVSSVFDLLRRFRVPLVLFENVPFMLRLAGGAAMEYLTSELEGLGYEWAYRVVDSRSFGLPQRRRRVFLLAALEEDPRPILFHDDRGTIDPEPEWRPGVPCGFYWTEGNRGVGWAVDAVPTLKGGSGWGIPSPPAVWTNSGAMRTPTIEDAEALQGLPRGWTEPAAAEQRPSARWRLVGNAVTMPVANWIGRRLAVPPGSGRWEKRPTRVMDGRWPSAGFSFEGRRFEITVSEWPSRHQRQPLSEFLSTNAPALSLRATRGFRERLERSSLCGFPRTAFLNALRAHEKALGSERRAQIGAAVGAR
jgi:DNA (cytosine-5)-methyltransferase 1